VGGRPAQPPYLGKEKQDREPEKTNERLKSAKNTLTQESIKKKDSTTVRRRKESPGGVQGAGDKTN